MELSTATIVGVEMRKWTEHLPTKEGWYFWRNRLKDVSYLYMAIYVFPVNEEEGLGPEYFESGTMIDMPKGGMWSSRIGT